MGRAAPARRRTPPRSLHPTATEAPAAAAPSASEVARTIRLSIAEGALSRIFLNWTTGSVLAGYMLHLGLPVGQVAMVSAVPQLAALVNPFVAYLVAAIGRRKALTIGCALGARLVWVAAAALPLFDLPPALKPSLLFGIVLLSSVMLAASGTLWTSWLGDVIPSGSRGRVFGLRAGMAGFVGTAANLLAGGFLDRVAAPLSFQIVFLVAVATSVLGALLLFAHADAPVGREPIRWRELLTLPWRDGASRTFLAFTAFWTFAVMTGGPLATAFYLDVLGLSFTQLMLATAVASTLSLVTTSTWGRIGDRVGHRRVAMLGTFLVGLLLPVNWILAGLTGNVLFIYTGAVAEAIAWGAVHPAVFSLALVVSTGRRRTTFLAMQGVTAGLAAFVGAAMSGPLLAFFTPFEFPVFGGTWTGYLWVFATSAVLRMLAWTFLVRLPERRADDGEG
jgi:MFS family permease